MLDNLNSANFLEKVNLLTKNFKLFSMENLKKESLRAGVKLFSMKLEINI
jgi:hypothetical protein